MSLATRYSTCCLLRRSLSSNENPVKVTRSYLFVNFVYFLFSFVNLFEIWQALHLQIRPCVGYTAWYKTVRDESCSTLWRDLMQQCEYRPGAFAICPVHCPIQRDSPCSLFSPNILLNFSLLYKLQYYRDVQPAIRHIVMRSVVTFVNCIHGIKITQFGRLGTPFILISFARMARKPPHHNGRGPSPQRGWAHLA
jgi:hypothetical protein